MEFSAWTREEIDTVFLRRAVTFSPTRNRPNSFDNHAGMHDTSDSIAASLPRSCELRIQVR